MARQLIVELLGDATKLTKSLKDAGTQTQSFGDKVQNAGRKMTTFVSVPIVGFLGASTKAAAEEEAQMSQLAATMQNTTGATRSQINATETWIASMQKATVHGDGELRPALNSLLLVTGDLGKSQKLLAFATDVAAASGKDLGTVVEAMKGAETGRIGTLERLGVVVAQNEDKTVDWTRTLEQSTGVQGAAARATETTSGRMKQLQNDMGDVQEKLGAQLLPVIKDVTGFFANSLVPTLDKMTGDNGALVLLGVAAAGPVLNNIVKLKNAVVGLNLTLDATAVKAAAALGAIGIVIQGIQTIKNEEGSLGVKIFGDTSVGRFISKTIPGLASGGPVTGGQPYIVGERGPEMFVPASSGTIVPNGAGAAGGPTTIVVQIGDREIGRVVADALRQNKLIGVT